VITLCFAHCSVRICFDTETVQTEFSDGTVCLAQPQYNDDYRNTAERLGYGDDTWTMCWEHELFHTMLALNEGLPYSPVLWDVAHGTEAKPHHWEEENRVMERQREVNERRRARHTAA